MENLNHAESSSSSSNQDLRRRIKYLPQPQLVDVLCNIASQHPSIAQEIEALTTVTPHRTLFVRNLSSRTNSRLLRRAFQRYGEIEEAFVVCDRVTKISKNYGFVTYKDVKSVQDALIQPSKDIDGSMAVCDVADERHRRNNISSDPDLYLFRKLYVGHLAAGVTSENLRSDFQIHGEIEAAVVMRNARYGFVTYKTEEAAKKAIDYNTLHPTFAEGKKRIVKYANRRRGPRALGRTRSPENEQPEDDYVDSPVPYAPPPAHSPYETYGVSYPHISAMTDQFGNPYYYDYSYPYQ
ncbi:UBP1-associated protein 2C-like [Vicia villosa]|uniref:UBP1-associated protein 2C-like n=1 Tax=Vicia villosa TaxID=3911 RepID=UPI00273BF1F4|nr:UBP1-associated protein 2C-like [Vicia villosa]